jgi:transposase-like protein
MRLASEVREQQRRPLQMLLNFLKVWYQPADGSQLANQSGIVPKQATGPRTDLLSNHLTIEDIESVQELGLRYTNSHDLAQLGGSLVRRLATIDMDRTTPTSLYKWRDNWRNFGTQHPEMQVPLRLLRVGIEYLIKQDRKVLLDVVLVERQILEQALKIERQAADI